MDRNQQVCEYFYDQETSETDLVHPRLGLPGHTPHKWPHLWDLGCLRLRKELTVRKAGCAVFLLVKTCFHILLGVFLY